MEVRGVHTVSNDIIGCRTFQYLEGILHRGRERVTLHYKQGNVFRVSRTG